MASAQTAVAALKTAQTELRVEAGPSVPRLSSVQNDTLTWKNLASETLIPEVEVAGRTAPLAWQFNRAESHADEHLVSFVYDAGSPRLRLTWEWQVRSARGPIEHQIRIENRDSAEVWLPLQSSFTFDWETSAQDKLEQFYVEKGADTPSAVGTHLVSVPDGYEWEGASSTYAQPRPAEQR